MALVVWASSTASAQSVSAPTPSAPATLYFHLISFQDFPINTQIPDPQYTETPATSLATETLSCLPDPPTVGNPFQAFHTWRGYSSPSYVEYGSEQDGNPRTAPERQMGYGSSLAAVAPMLHFFLETTAGAAGPVDDPPVVVPDVVIEATVRASSDGMSMDDKAYDTGPVLFHGRSQPALLAMDATQGAIHTMAGSHHVYEFIVPMPIERAGLGDKGFTVRIDAYQDNPACGDPDHAVMTNTVQPFLDADHLPRIELAVQDPLRILSLVPRFDNGTIQVHAEAQAVWGSHDVDEGNLTLVLDGPAVHAESSPDRVVQHTHEYGHHSDPVQLDWNLIRPSQTGLYWLNLTLTNDQHTANATAHAAFRLGPDIAYGAPAGGGPPNTSLPTQAMPLPGLAMAGASLALGLLLRRRRR